MNLPLIAMDKPKAGKKRGEAEAHLSHLSLDDKDILKNIKKLKLQMDCVYDQLNFVTDETLIDGYVYEMKSIHMKYNYYINLCKQRGLAVELF